MALVSKLQPRRVPIPHEPGEWIELKPPTGGQWAAALKDDAAPSEYLRTCVTGWSYDAPVNAETIADLDIATSAWLIKQVSAIVAPGGKEGNESAPDSKATT